MLKWGVSETPKPVARDPTNPLLSRPELGTTRQPIHQDVMDRVHGKRSEDPSIRGGVSGAFGGWREDSNDGRRAGKYKVSPSAFNPSRPFPAVVGNCEWAPFNCAPPTPSAAGGGW
jgi:hypothetical protein